MPSMTGKPLYCCISRSASCQLVACELRSLLPHEHEKFRLVGIAGHESLLKIVAVLVQQELDRSLPFTILANQAPQHLRREHRVSRKPDVPGVDGLTARRRRQFRMLK